MKPVLDAGFTINQESSAKSLPPMSRIYYYRRPRLVKAKYGWYIEYYYRVPWELKDILDGREFHRFRLFEDINKRRGEDKEEYAEWLLIEVTLALQKGFDPFKPLQNHFKREEIDEPKVLDATDAMNMFIDKWDARGAEKNTMKRYKMVARRFIEWLRLKRIPYIDIREITIDHIETFLKDAKEKYKYGTRSSNNTYDILRTIFNFLTAPARGHIPFNPCDGIIKVKTKSRKHRYYDDLALKKIMFTLEEVDPYLHLAFQMVYYLCIRSGKELLNLKVESFLWDQDKVLLDITKTKTERYVPLDENIKNTLMDYIGDAPADYYIFSADHKNKFVAMGKPGPQPVNYTFFAKRFNKARESAGLPSHYSLYGAKHTRVIHLKQDGVDDATIMMLTGHEDFTAYAKYLRDLGLAADVRRLKGKSRKI